MTPEPSASRRLAASTRGAFRDFRDATDVADWRLCIGCGACVAACGEGRLAMVDHVRDGLRPVHATRAVERELRFFREIGAAPVALKPSGARAGAAAEAPATAATTAAAPALASSCGSCRDCLDVCPGLGASHDGPMAPPPGREPLRELAAGWGPVLEVWEGHATDPEMRAGGSSAGLASVLALHAVEHEGLAGVLHVGSDDQARWLNRTVYSRSRDELLARTGSRYAPASPCEGLAALDHVDGPSVFIGKPCDVEGVRKWQALRPGQAGQVGLAIGIFCAGTPSTQGTLDLLAKHGIRREDVEDLRYRGRGWPGTFAVKLKGEDEWRDLATYAEAWGFLQAYRPHRCYLCPDSSSEFADISCGDPWYHDTSAHQPGLSLVLVRTERGREAVRAAMASGAVSLRRVGADALERSQAELQRKRGAIWGRLLTLRALGVPAPRFEGFPLFRHWRGLPAMEQLRSFAGTARRVLSRGYRRPLSASSVRRDESEAATRRPAAASVHDEALRPTGGREGAAGELVRAAVPGAVDRAGHAVAVDRDG